MHRNFLRASLICLIPLLLALFVVGRTYVRYENNEGGFKLGVDLVGGTILVYEVDQERERQRRNLERGDSSAAGGAKTSQALAEAIKRRIDPNDTQNIIVRPAGDNRIEVILPTGTHRQNADGKKNVNTGDIAEIRHLIEQVGSLEFRILANAFDDEKAFVAAEELFDKQSDKDLASLALGGEPPPPPINTTDDPWTVHGDKARYAWVELHSNARKELKLLNQFEEEDKGNQEKSNWYELQRAREKHKVVRLDRGKGGLLLFSRDCTNVNLPENLRKEKKYEYFILTRISDRVEVDGTKVTIVANSDNDPQTFAPEIGFRFNSEGAGSSIN